MERAALPRGLTWQLSSVVELVDETPRTKSIALALPVWPGHRAGQHVDVRLTAEDGYQAQRSYAIASAPEDDHVVLPVERLDDGEVFAVPGRRASAGRPAGAARSLGGYFVWEASLGGPLLLLAGGSGVVPLRAILRHHRVVESTVPARLLYWARALDDVIYRDELMANAFGDSVDIRFTLTREQPEGWRGWERWTDMELLQEVTWPPRERPLIYVCGPTPFVDRATFSLIALGHEPGRVLHVAFGPTGVQVDGVGRKGIAGTMMGVFGHEATTAFGACASCGARSMVFEFRVFLRAPGVVARGRQCGSVVMVFVEARGVTCVDLRGLAALDPA